MHVGLANQAVGASRQLCKPGWRSPSPGGRGTDRRTPDNRATVNRYIGLLRREFGDVDWVKFYGLRMKAVAQE